MPMANAYVTMSTTELLSSSSTGVSGTKPTKSKFLDLKLENWQFEQKGTCLKIHIVNAQILEAFH